MEAQKSGCGGSFTAAEALAALNEARQSPRECGSTTFPAVSPLEWDVQLESAAQQHSSDMARRNFFDHTNPDGISASERVTAAGYGSFTRTGENISAGPKSMQRAMQGWLKSPGHCENIMRASYKHYAIACASSEGSRYGTYWTQVFGSK